ncbi:polyadenylate-binding protein-interacting protein 7-like isoform X2 [Macadamia integrifolia]|uniref:polyadenylate-binding protein-interacting protein 7-like isoform X2 n=1 Tax=Macadamia integrifolia TaxID=60698 RepID=UPI001C4FE217|nr:polyadenylate-binding protein-interacting protein 7-like isoform X2 [Macadamia integrifolia]
MYKDLFVQFQIMMSLSRKVISTNDMKPNASGMTTTLNPNAAEFIPSAFRSSSGSLSSAHVTARLNASGTSGKAVLDRSESTVSNNSDEEAHQYWRCQLPDDITPDFKFMGEDESQGPESLSLASLSIDDQSDSSRFSVSTGSGQILSKQQVLSPHGFMNGNQHIGSKGRDGFTYNVNPIAEFPNDTLNENGVLEDININPVEFLASQFPGFAAESLAEVYYANGCDLNLTIEMLTQLELQVDGGFNQNLNSKTPSSPNLSALDFPALTAPDDQNGLSNYVGDDIQQAPNPYRSSDKDAILFFKSSSSTPSRGGIDFASTVRKLASQDSGQWKYERNGSSDTTVGSSRSSHNLVSSYSGGHVRPIHSDRLESHASARGAPWLETGDVVANMYSELRGEARDHARLRNAYFDQAQQAYNNGNKALAKELSVKGQVHNMHMKAAHIKAQESIYRHRNPVAREFHGSVRGQQRMIDLHGLHVNEAIHVLKNELSILRSLARSAAQRLQVYICVGTGHHTKGSRTPARLPIAVEQYLLEEEGLNYTENQPGLLEVVIY